MVAKKSISRIFSVLFVFIFMLSVMPLQAAHAVGMMVRYVKPVASEKGDCSNWANACELQTALTGSISGQEIWVTVGTYKPTTGTDRSATFRLIDGVALYGGFVGTETKRTQRNPATNVIILSGDIGTVSDNNDNSYHVVTGAAGATLDGFTITAGKANGSGSLSYGGGMYNSGVSPALTDVTFSSNSATSGGGMSNNSGSSPTLTDVTFSGNSAGFGGGMYNEYQSSPNLTNVTFSGNSANFDGAGMDNTSGSSPTLTNVTFSDNVANRWAGLGGGMNNISSSPTLTNVTFSGNSADYGGGMNNISSSPTLTNVTFSGNSASGGGGAIENSGSTATIRNTVFWGNTAPSGAQIQSGSGDSSSVSDSIVQGGYAGGTNIITADPNLGTLGNYGGLTQTIPLQAGSSAIDATSSNCPTTDQRGVLRSNPTCDIGAYEVQTILLAAPGGQTSGLCQSWANACELSYALTSAVSGQEIWVAVGTHKPTAGTDRGATFQLKDGVALYGGFAGTETSRTQRNPTANVTTLSGEIGAADNSDNSYHVVTGATGATLDGFTITAGNANAVTTLNKYGGGMYNYFSSPVLMNVTFSGNTAQYGGGGMHNESGSPALTNITFSGNSAQYGGGMHNYSSSPALTNVTS
jgi:predicted outer membrane repeat protein